MAQTNQVVNQVVYDTSGRLVKQELATVDITKGTLALTDVHADIGVTTVFTPDISGLYLYSFYGLATTAPSGADAAPNLYLSWTDTHGTQTYFNFAGNLDPVYSDGPNSVSMPIYAIAGSPITFHTTAGNYSGTIRWSFYFSVTQL